MPPKTTNRQAKPQAPVAGVTSSGGGSGTVPAVARAAPPAGRPRRAAVTTKAPAKAKATRGGAETPAKAPRTLAALPAKATRDPEQTRARILEAAKAEFARVGLGGARVDRIALEAGANKRMLYYYFGNKEDLFLAVLEGAYEHIRNAEKNLRLEEVDPPEAIRRLVTFTWTYYLDHPEFLNLLNSENLHQGRHLKGSGTVRSMHSPFVSMIGQILERGARSGDFRPGVDPMQLYISIAGLSYFYLGNNYTLSAIFGRDLKASKAKAQRLAHMHDVVLGYLAPAGAAQS